ncbi:MAG TPA: hypothetical protein VE153_17135 [Myxococcus sp.]|jgi:hypothetical protein|nr:hypothetical protein [Myxococcus sp.]
MAQIPDFDLDDIIATLSSVSRNRTEDAKERSAIELAQIALLYARHAGRLDDFRKYYGEFFDPSFKVQLAHEFSTREEADAWLASGKARHAEHVKIAGRGYQVVQLPGRMTFIDRPLPEELKEDSE